MKKNLFVWCALFAVSISAFATTITVTSNTSTGDNSFDAAVAASVKGDTINFNFDGTDIFLSSAMTMKSLVVNGINAFNGQKVILKPGTTNMSIFSFASGDTATLSNLVFDGLNINGNTNIKAAYGSKLSIEGCIFKDINAQANNGAAARIQGESSITNSSFINNSCGGSYGGGALCIYNAADVAIDKCSFIGNTVFTNGVSNGGGAIVARSTTADTCNVSIANSTFANNMAGQYGGALLASVVSSSVYTANIKAINCTFTGNKGIGAISALTTVKGNANVLLVNSIVVNNVDADSTNYLDIYEKAGTDAATVAVVNVNNVLYSVAPTIVTTNKNCILVADPSTANIFKTYETFSTDKKRPVLSTVGDMTVAMIAETSIAKNAGTASLTDCIIPIVDQLGETRPTTPSIGAVEYKLIETGLSQETASKISFFVNNRNVVLSGIPETSIVCVYNTQGNLVKKELVNDHASISMENIPGNLFFVKIGNSTFKVLVH